MGNRGKLHDTGKRIIRDSASAMWLICELEFNGRKQELMHPKRYTQLFFLDEAVALAAGHRPCGECRRKYYRAYIDAANVASDDPISGAAQLDKRLVSSRKEARPVSRIDSLPDGAFVTLGENDFRLVWRRTLYKWSPSGYVEPLAIADADVTEALVITPTLSIEALRHGYPVTMHSSVEASVPEVAVKIETEMTRSTFSSSRGQAPPSGLTAELRPEIERILRNSSPGLTHGELFRYSEQGLGEEEIVARHGTGLSNVRNFMRSLDHLFGGTIPDTKSAARKNSMVYKELLNHDLSPELLSHVKQQLRSLMLVNPKINMAPLRTRNYQYSANPRPHVVTDSMCPRCRLVHAGECD